MEYIILVLWLLLRLYHSMIVIDILLLSLLLSLLLYGNIIIVSTTI